MRTNGKYILDANGEPQLCDDWREWARWYETAERHIGNDTIEGVQISTVFLSLDHNLSDGPPVLWETMVFGGLLDGEQDRYTSKADALAGHHAICERVRAAIDQPDAVQR